MQKEQQINTLLKRNYDAERGYKEAADHVEAPGIQQFLKHNFEERYRFGHEIKDILSDMNVKPNKGTTMEADLHRGFMKIKELITGNDTAAILEECKRGEEHALADYAEVVKNEAISQEHKRVLSDQMHSIRKSVEQIDKLMIKL